MADNFVSKIILHKQLHSNKNSDPLSVFFVPDVSKCRVNSRLAEWPEYNYTHIISRKQCAHCRDFRCLCISGLYNN